MMDAIFYWEDYRERKIDRISFGYFIYRIGTANSAIKIQGDSFIQWVAHFFLHLKIIACKQHFITNWRDFDKKTDKR